MCQHQSVRAWHHPPPPLPPHLRRMALQLGSASDDLVALAQMMLHDGVLMSQSSIFGLQHTPFTSLSLDAIAAAAATAVHSMFPYVRVCPQVHDCMVAGPSPPTKPTNKYHMFE